MVTSHRFNDPSQFPPVFNLISGLQTRKSKLGITARSHRYLRFSMNSNLFTPSLLLLCLFYPSLCPSYIFSFFCLPVPSRLRYCPCHCGKWNLPSARDEQAPCFVAAPLTLSLVALPWIASLNVPCFSCLCMCYCFLLLETPSPSVLVQERPPVMLGSCIISLRGLPNPDSRPPSCVHILLFIHLPTAWCLAILILSIFCIPVSPVNWAPQKHELCLLLPPQLNIRHLLGTS